MKHIGGEEWAGQSGRVGEWGGVRSGSGELQGVGGVRWNGWCEINHGSHGILSCSYTY